VREHVADVARDEDEQQRRREEEQAQVQHHVERHRAARHMV
jgi:hypothetical protein